jgi:hypothetical protein
MAENRERIVDQQPETQVETRKPITEMVDLQKNREVTVPREVRTWMEKVESEPTTLTQQPTNKGDDDSILQPIAPTVHKITLPSDKKSFVTGFGKPVDEAWRWLSEFLLRVIKKNQGNVKFKEE